MTLNHKVVSSIHAFPLCPRCARSGRAHGFCWLGIVSVCLWVRGSSVAGSFCPVAAGRQRPPTASIFSLTYVPSHKATKILWLLTNKAPEYIREVTLYCVLCDCQLLIRNDQFRGCFDLIWDLQFTVYLGLGSFSMQCVYLIRHQ